MIRLFKSTFWFLAGVIAAFTTLFAVLGIGTAADEDIAIYSGEIFHGWKLERNE